MAAVDEGGPLPPPLRLAFMVRFLTRELGATFTEAMSADYDLMTRMMALYNVHGAMTRLRGARGDQIHDLSASDGQIIATLQKAGLL